MVALAKPSGMKIDVQEVGPFAMNAMIVYDEASKRAFLLDPGDEVPRLLRRSLH